MSLEKTIQLLRRFEKDFPQVQPLLLSDLSKVGFYGFELPSPTTTKEHILDIYKVRASTESMMQKHNTRKDNSQVVGYDTLLSRLQNTRHKHICISDIDIADRSYIIFSDFERTELIGVLVSKY